MKKPRQIKHKWTDEEKAAFVIALKKYGEKSLKKISEAIGTRTVVQVRSHLQKYKMKLGKFNEQAPGAKEHKYPGKKIMF